MPCSPKNDPLFACLVLERGAPYEKGACFLLQPAKQTDAGKEHELVHPRYHVRQPADIPKTLLYRTARRGWSICELKSKHGTLLNGEPLPQSYPSRSSTGIKSVWRQTLCRCGFPDPRNWTRRSIITAPTLYRALPCRNRPSPWSSTPRKSPCWSAAQEVTLSAKEWLLLELVYKHRNELVTYDSIRMTVWAERVSSAGRPPKSRSRRNKPSPVRACAANWAPVRDILKTRRGRGCLLEIG